MGVARPDCSNSREFPVACPAGKIQIPGPSSRYMLLISDLSPLSHSQIPGLFAIPKIFDCVGRRTSPSSKSTFCWVRSARVQARLAGNHALAFLRNGARNENLLQRPLTAQVPQTNAQKMKCLARWALTVRKTTPGDSLETRRYSVPRTAWVRPTALQSADRGRGMRRLVATRDLRFSASAPRPVDCQSSRRRSRSTHRATRYADRLRRSLLSARCSSSIARGATAGFLPFRSASERCRASNI